MSHTTPGVYIVKNSSVYAVGMGDIKIDFTIIKSISLLMIIANTVK